MPCPLVCFGKNHRRATFQGSDTGNGHALVGGGVSGSARDMLEEACFGVLLDSVHTLIEYAPLWAGAMPKTIMKRIF